jgi:uncharacterized protein
MSRPPPPPSFVEIQRQFAAHIRDPSGQPAPGDISPRRMRVYTELFFRNIEQLLANGFPVIRRILADDEWHGLVRDFMVQHRCRTPLFTEVGHEFVAFLSSHEPALAPRPFIAELARYEQLEVEASLAPDPPAGSLLAPESTLLDRRLQLSPSVRIGQFSFPVHRVGPGFQPAEAPASPTWLLVYRDPDDRVRFMELNGFAYTLLALIDSGSREPARTLLASLAAALDNAGLEDVIDAGHGFLQDLCSRGVLGLLE